MVVAAPPPPQPRRTSKPADDFLTRPLTEWDGEVVTVESKRAWIGARAYRCCAHPPQALGSRGCRVRFQACGRRQRAASTSMSTSAVPCACASRLRADAELASAHLGSCSGPPSSAPATCFTSFRARGSSQTSCPPTRPPTRTPGRCVPALARSRLSPRLGVLTPAGPRTVGLVRRGGGGVQRLAGRGDSGVLRSEEPRAAAPRALLSVSGQRHVGGSAARDSGHALVGRHLDAPQVRPAARRLVACGADSRSAASQRRAAV